MGHKNDLRSQQGRCPHIFDNIIIITDQDTAFPSIDLKTQYSLPGVEVRIDKGMQFSKLGYQAIPVYADISFENPADLIFFKEAR
jgi:hypothetical protein